MKTFIVSTVLVVFLALVFNNVSGLESENIIGGSFADKNQYQYQISLQAPNGHICGGTLIKSDLVLTAAHCVSTDTASQYKPRPYMVVAGTINVQNKDHRILVKKVYIHKGFKHIPNSVALNDIAILKLEKGFDVSGRLPISTMRLPLKNEKFVGKKGVVSGFGWDKIKIPSGPLMSKPEGSSSGVLKYATVEVMEPSECSADIYPGLLCGQTKQYARMMQGVCDGDSGGPLVVDGKVVGIVSTSPTGCDESEEAASYTQVSDFTDFIKDVINGKETKDMVVKTVEFVIFDIPTMNLKGITNSTELQAVLRKLQDIHPEYTVALEDVHREQEKLKPIDQEIDEIEARVSIILSDAKRLESNINNSLEDYQAYKDKFAQYKTQKDLIQAKMNERHAQYKIYSAKFDDMKILETKVNVELQKFNNLQKTVDLYAL